MRWVVSWSHYLQFYAFPSPSGDLSNISLLWQKIRRVAIPPAALTWLDSCFQNNIPSQVTAQPGVSYWVYSIHCTLKKDVFSCMHQMKHNASINMCQSNLQTACSFSVQMEEVQCCAEHSAKEKIANLSNLMINRRHKFHLGNKWFEENNSLQVLEWIKNSVWLKNLTQTLSVLQQDRAQL